MKTLTWYARAVLAIPIGLVAGAVSFAAIALWALAFRTWSAPTSYLATVNRWITRDPDELTRAAADGSNSPEGIKNIPDEPHPPTEEGWRDLGRPPDRLTVDFGAAADIDAIAIVDHVGHVTRVPTVTGDVPTPQYQPSDKERFLAAVVENVGRGVYRIDERQASFLGDQRDDRRDPQVH